MTVAGSTVDIHGKQFHPTWTRLAATARTQDDRVYLQEAVNWEIGQQVVVTTTVYKDKEDPQNEVRTIAAVSSNRKIIQFTQPLDFTHYAGQEYQVCAPLASMSRKNESDSDLFRSFGAQAEVALLSRRVVVQGDAGSENDEFGAQVRVRGPPVGPRR
jgi:hypothetical protein